MLTKESVIQATEEGNLTNLRSLISKGADINTSNSFGETLLFLAAQKGHKEIVAFLIEQGANLHASNSGGQNAIFAACKTGHIDIVNTLIGLGVNPKQLTKIGNSAFQIAVKYGHLDIIQYFIKNKIVDIKELGQLKIYKTSNDTIKKILDYFFEAYSPLSTEIIHRYFTQLISIGHVPGVDYLLEKHPHLAQEFGLFLTDLLYSNIVDENRATPLVFKKLKICSPIIKKYASEITIYPLHQDSILSHLLKSGLSFETLDSAGQTLLHLAASNQMDEYENISLLPYLLDLGYPIDLLNKKGQTPLMIAIEQGWFFHALYLIYRGANVNLCDTEGKEPLQYAEQFSEVGFQQDQYHTEFAIQFNLTLRMDLVQLLKDYGA